MRKYLNAEIMQQSMKLKQMGADVTVINSKLCYIAFDLSGFKVSYVYNVNKKNKYFLERIKPYPLPLREFDNEDDVIDIINIDLDQFRNAIKSHNIESFITIARKLDSVFHKFEDLFLYYNLPEDETKRLYDEILEMEKDIERIKESSERICYDKDPEYLK
tara:strand:- start:72 stop:554 length:483 start_codon:yes stop_codon:yes gene_type:complete